MPPLPHSHPAYKSAIVSVSGRPVKYWILISVISFAYTIDSPEHVDRSAVLCLSFLLLSDKMDLLNAPQIKA